MENLCEYSSRLRSDFDQCSGTVSKITGQEAFICGLTRSIWLCRNHAKRFATQNQTSCCFEDKSCTFNNSYYSPCPKRLINVLTEMPRYNGGTFLCKQHLEFMDQDPEVTKHALYKPPKKRKVHTKLVLFSFEHCTLLQLRCDSSPICLF